MLHEQSAPIDLDSTATHRRAMLAGLGGLAAGALLSGKAQAGPLDPPAGPVASTGKILTEIEPRTAINAINTPGSATAVFTITQPGSYYLTGNVTGVSGKNGIEIDADGVTLDLMGFELVGTAGSLAGIQSVGTGRSSLAMTNGTVRNWPVRGVSATFTSGTRIDGLRAIANGFEGITAGTNCHISNSMVFENTSDGIRVQSGSTITGCLAIANGNIGVITSVGCTISDCTARSNAAEGFFTGSGTTIVNCTSSSNERTGFTLGSGGSTAINCSANSNTIHGFNVGTQSSLSQCVARSNTQNGILTGSACVVANCLVASNAGQGIEVFGDCLVRGNNCDQNLTGIRANSSDNRIEDNNCTDNGLGIECVVAGNFVARNTCSGNTTNWSMAANNVCLVLVANPSAAFSGNSGGISPGTTNPYANFTY